MAQEKLRTQVQHAQKLEAVGQLAAGVAHGYNNLLTIITGRAEFGLQHARVGDPLEIAPANPRGRRTGRRADAATPFHQWPPGRTEPVHLDLHRLVVSMQGLIRDLVGDTIAVVVRSTPAPGCVRADRTQESSS